MSTEDEVTAAHNLPSAVVEDQERVTAAVAPNNEYGVGIGVAVPLDGATQAELERAEREELKREILFALYQNATKSTSHTLSLPDDEDEEVYDDDDDVDYEDDDEVDENVVLRKVKDRFFAKERSKKNKRKRSGGRKASKKPTLPYHHNNNRQYQLGISAESTGME